MAYSHEAWRTSIALKCPFLFYLYCYSAYFTSLYSIKVKVKVTTEEATKAQRCSSTLSLTSALDGVGGQRHAPAALPLGKRPGTHCVGGWVGPKVGVDGCGKSRPPTGIRSRTVQAVASCYTDSATMVYIQFLSLYMPLFFNGLKNNCVP
jgi:hypothetical protein